jgi:D-arabinose 1-dehydrogenase-like Zn-dependent alcohol dehydrogenase
MKAVRLLHTGRPLEMQDLPLPTLGEGEILVKVHASGICHSDVHYRAGTSPVRSLPITPGQDVAAVVAEVGSHVTHLQPGDRVALHYLVTCGDCAYCTTGHEQFCPTGAIIGKHRDGGYAEYIAVPARNAVRLPDEICTTSSNALSVAGQDPSSAEVHVNPL